MIYVVTGYRWGLRDDHSYVVAVDPDFDKATQLAREELEYRGGKYAMEITRHQIGERCGGDNPVVAYMESPYFGKCGGKGHDQPCDYMKVRERR